MNQVRVFRPIEETYDDKKAYFIEFLLDDTKYTKTFFSKEEREDYLKRLDKKIDLYE